MPYVRRRMVVVGALVAVAACQESALEPRPPEVPVVVPASVTPEVASALGPDGRFLDAFTNRTEVNGTTSRDAEDLAYRYLRSFGLGDADLLSSDHGAPVKPDQLRICRKTQYAEPSITVADTVGAPRIIKESIEGAFLVSLCRPDDSFVAALVAVTPSAVSYRFGDRISWPSDGGRAIIAFGVRRGEEPFPSAESAINATWQSAKVRAAGVPRLLLPHPRYSPHFARWAVPLESDVNTRVERNQSRRTVGQLIFGVTTTPPRRDRVLLVPSTEAIEERLRALWFTDRAGAVREWEVLPRQGAAVQYDVVTVGGGR